MLKMSSIRVKKAHDVSRSIAPLYRNQIKRMICRVYAPFLTTFFIVVVISTTSFASRADTWRSVTGFGAGSGTCYRDPMSNSGSGCTTGEWSWNYIIGDPIKISPSPNQPGTVNAYWIGITGSGTIHFSSVPPGNPQYPNRNLTCGSGCFFGVVGNAWGSINATTYSCQYQGINCDTNAFWMGTGSSQTASPSPGWGNPSYTITGGTSSPAWMLVIDPADANQFVGAGGGSIRGYLPYSSQKIRLLVSGSSGEDGQPNVVLWYSGFPSMPQMINPATDGIIVPPIVPPPVIPTVQCDVAVDGPIDLGTVDQTNAMGRTASTWLRVQCTDDATVKATVRLSGGANNVASLGGLTIPVTFDNNTDTSSWTVSDTAPSATKLTAAVTNVGTTVPGEYSQSMVVNLTYE